VAEILVTLMAHRGVQQRATVVEHLQRGAEPAPERDRQPGVALEQVGAVLDRTPESRAVSIDTLEQFERAELLVRSGWIRLSWMKESVSTTILETP